MTTERAPGFSTKELNILARIEATPAAPESFDATAALRRVLAAHLEPGMFSPEVQAKVDELLGRGVPIGVEFRQRLIAAAQRGMKDRREAATRAHLQAPCRCGHPRVEHRSSTGCGVLVEWQPCATVPCPCPRWVAVAAPKSGDPS